MALAREGHLGQHSATRTPALASDDIVSCDRRDRVRSGQPLSGGKCVRSVLEPVRRRLERGVIALRTRNEPIFIPQVPIGGDLDSMLGLEVALADLLRPNAGVG